MDKIYQNRDWLQEQYVNMGESIREMAKRAKCARKTIRRWLHKTGIPIRELTRIKDLTGCHFGRLTVLCPTKERYHKQVVWFCKCSCGTTTKVASHHLISGNTRSCGCLLAEIASKKAAQQRGPKHPNWNPNLTNEDRELSRKIPGYNEWREAIFERDNYTCQKCGEKGGRLNAHHIESYRDNPELRTALENGVTLCKKHHDDFHHQYGYGDNTREQFEEFLKSREGILL